LSGEASASGEASTIRTAAVAQSQAVGETLAAARVPEVDEKLEHDETDDRVLQE